MNNKYQIFLISTLPVKPWIESSWHYSHNLKILIMKERICFHKNGTTNRKIVKECKTKKNSIILYTIVDTKLAKFLGNESLKTIFLVSVFSEI